MDIFDYSAYPTGAWLTVNRNCNFRCKWCYAKETDYVQSHSMTLSMARNISEILFELGIKEIKLIGGEPSLWSYLFPFNDFAKEKNIQTTIITNAFAFGLDSFWENYQKHPCTYAVNSIKGITPEKLFQVTGVRNIEQVKTGISRSLSFHKSSGVETVCSSITSIDELLDIARFSKKHGAKSFLISGCNVILSNESATNNFSMLSTDEMDKLINAYPTLNQMFADRLEIQITQPLCIWPKGFIDMLMNRNQLSGPCNVQNRTGLVFDYNGDILFCNSIFDTVIARYPQDYTNAEELIEFLNSASLKKEYSEVLRYPSEECSKCSVNYFCRGGCIANWMIMDPSICNAR